MIEERQGEGERMGGERIEQAKQILIAEEQSNVNDRNKTK